MKNDRRITQELLTIKKEGKCVDEESNIWQLSEKDEIQFCMDDADIRNLRILMTGPKDTPFEFGFYFFDLTQPERQPWEPPKVKFLSTDGHKRMHPNLQENGKVCLSILNTWQGPSWSPMLNVKAVALTIQSLLTDNPIVNEPGYETYAKTHETARKQNEVLMQFNQQQCIEFLCTKEERFRAFRNVMSDLIRNNWDVLVTRIDEKCGEQIGKDTNISSGFYNQKANVEWDKVKDSQMTLADTLGLGVTRATEMTTTDVVDGTKDKALDHPEETKETDAKEEMTDAKEEEGGMFKNIMEKLFK